MSAAPVEEDLDPNVDRTSARTARILCMSAYDKAVVLKTAYHEFRRAGIDIDLILAVASRFYEYSDLKDAYYKKSEELKS